MYRDVLLWWSYYELWQVAHTAPRKQSRDCPKSRFGTGPGHRGLWRLLFKSIGLGLATQSRCVKAQTIQGFFKGMAAHLKIKVTTGCLGRSVERRLHILYADQHAGIDWTYKGANPKISEWGFLVYFTTFYIILYYVLSSDIIETILGYTTQKTCSLYKFVER